jgi:RNA polymerase sigma-70 factor (ECF subfamily)
MDDLALDFQEIYDAFHPKITGYLRRLVGDAEAEDVAQEVFVKVSRALPEFRGESRLSTWIYQIATNAARDRLRSASFRQTARENPPDILAADGEAELADQDAWTGKPALSVEGQVVRQEMDDCIQEFMMRLPEDYRIVLALSDLEGLKDRQIADILGIKLGAAKIRLHRAREKLRKDLVENCDSYWVEGNEFVPNLWKASNRPPKTP